jgi:hypothetical protein
MCDVSSLSVSRWFLVGALAGVGLLAGWMVAMAGSLCVVDAHDAAASSCEVTLVAWTVPRGVGMAVWMTLGAVVGYVAGTLISKAITRHE